MSEHGSRLGTMIQQPERTGPLTEQPSMRGVGLGLTEARLAFVPLLFIAEILGFAATAAVLGVFVTTDVIDGVVARARP